MKITSVKELNTYLTEKGVLKRGLTNAEKVAVVEFRYYMSYSQYGDENYPIPLDFSKFIYSSNTSGLVICPKHGEFYKQPSALQAGHGCHECWKEMRRFVEYVEHLQETI